MLPVAQLVPIDELRHAVKVDQQAEEYLVRGWAVFVDASEIAQDGDAWHVLTVKSKHARGLWAEVAGSVRRRDVAMNVFMVHVVGRRDLGEETRDHLNDVRHGHGADLKLPGLGSMTGEMGSM